MLSKVSEANLGAFAFSDSWTISLLTVLLLSCHLRSLKLRMLRCSVFIIYMVLAGMSIAKQLRIMVPDASGPLFDLPISEFVDSLMFAGFWVFLYAMPFYALNAVFIVLYREQEMLMECMDDFYEGWSEKFNRLRKKHTAHH
jgi:hypothetical protein